jgi:hypothetical protein
MSETRQAEVSLLHKEREREREREEEKYSHSPIVICIKQRKTKLCFFNIREN